MSVLGGHVTISLLTFPPIDQCNDQTLYEFRVNSVQRGAPGQFVPFPCGSFRGKQNKYAVRRAPLKLLFLNQRKRKNGLRNIFMTKSSQKNVLDVGIDHVVASIPSGIATNRATMPRRNWRKQTKR